NVTLEGHAAPHEDARDEPIDDRWVNLQHDPHDRIDLVVKALDPLAGDPGARLLEPLTRHTIIYARRSVAAASPLRPYLMVVVVAHLHCSSPCRSLYAPWTWARLSAAHWTTHAAAAP